MLRAVLAAQGNSKGKAWREGQCLALFNFPMLARAAFAGLLANWEYRGGYRFPTRHTKPCLQSTSQAGLFSCVIPRRENGTRPYIPSILVCASRLVRCDLFRATIKETRKEREGEEKLLRIGQ